MCSGCPSFAPRHQRRWCAFFSKVGINFIGEARQKDAEGNEYTVPIVFIEAVVIGKRPFCTPWDENDPDGEILFWRVRCPYCGGTHDHAAIQGVHQANCPGGGGYYLIGPPEDARPRPRLAYSRP